jgi:uncharacterized protein YbjT (DUF2867 family)
MTAAILLTGGTGTLGRLIAPRLREAGATVRILSRRAHRPVDGIEYVSGDLDTGVGVEAAVAGIATVVHCAGSHAGDGGKATTLARYASRAGVGHLVYISVVGADRVPVVSRTDRAMFGYFASKLAGERAVEESGIPWTTLRATQFHDLMLVVVRGLAKLPVIPVPAGVRFQPIDADDVAARMTELALGRPAGLVADIAGPRIYPTEDLVRAYLRATHRRRPLLPVALPGRAARAVRAGAILAPAHSVPGRTWEEFLAEKVPAPR